MSNLIEVTNVTKRFGETVAVDQLSLIVPGGSIFGLLGPNGSGKTTTIEMIAGNISPCEGEIRVCGLDVGKEPIEVKRRIGIVPDCDEVIEDLTAFEFLQFVCAIRGIPSAHAIKRIQDWLALFQLLEHQHRLLSTFSHGMRKKVQLIAALLHQPKLLILDEPTTGLDPDMVVTFKQVLKRLKLKGISILLSTHHLDLAEELCDEVCLIQQGKTLAVGKIEAILRQCRARNLEEAYVKLNKTENQGEKIDAILDHW